MATVLDKIMERKRLEVAAAKAARPLAGLEQQLATAAAVRDFFAAVSAVGVCN